MKRIKFFAGILMLVLLASCARYKDIEMGAVQDFEIEGFNKDALVLNITVPISNPSAFNISVIEVDARAYINDKYIGKVNSVDTVMLKKKSEEIYDLSFDVRLANFLGSAMKLMNLQRGDALKIRLEGIVTAKVMGMRKKIDFDETKDVIL